jgi:hypothetical protein
VRAAAVRHFYHLYAGGAWAQPAIEHAAALAGFDGHITMSLVGPAGDRHSARVRLAPLLPIAVDWIEVDGGSEQATLRAIADWARTAGDSVVLYAHTKGSHRQSIMQSAWRRSMTHSLLGQWRNCVELLKEYDTVGCHWLTPADSSDRFGDVRTPYYAGNFWWATASYLRRLPPLGPERSDAEGWIGLGSPRAYDLLPGWPSGELFTRLNMSGSHGAIFR